MVSLDFLLQVVPRVLLPFVPLQMGYRLRLSAHIRERFLFAAEKLKSNMAKICCYREEIKYVKLSWNGEVLVIAGSDRVELVNVIDGDVRRIEVDGRVQAVQWSPARLVLAWVTAKQGETSGKWYSLQM